MVGINCLFNYDGVNYRLNIDSMNAKDTITFEELRKTLRGHPKLREVDLFDAEKYVIEIYDKGFDDYVKLPKDANIYDYTKLRARLRPKPTLTLTKKDEESRKRPLSMYAEINIEEEHAQKVLRGSPPPSSTPRIRASSPSSSSRRSHLGVTEPSRSEYLSRSYASVKTPAQSKPSPIQTSSFKPKPSPSSRLQQPPQPLATKPLVPKKTPVVSRTLDTSTNPFSSSNSSAGTSTSSKITIDSNTARAKSFHGNGNNLPLGVDLDSYLLAKAVDKYDDEFTNIVMFDEIWETDHVWPFVFREISAQGVKSIKSVKEARSAFKTLIDKYIEILQKTHLTEAAANELWPFFDIFHTKLNIQPFYERIQTLKDTFNKRNKVDGDKPSSASSSQTIATSSIKSPQAPNPHRTQAQAPSDDIILLSCDETDKSEVRMEEDEDEIQEVHPNTSPVRQISPINIPTSSSSPPSSPPTTIPKPSQSIIAITSDDFRLLSAVEDHNKEFYDDIIPEYSVWRDVTDQINLFKPFEPSLVMKYKTRFYELLREFIRIENSSIPVTEKAQWKLYSLFINIDIEPFLSKL